MVSVVEFLWVVVVISVILQSLGGGLSSVSASPGGEDMTIIKRVIIPQMVGPDNWALYNESIVDCFCHLPGRKRDSVEDGGDKWERLCGGFEISCDLIGVHKIEVYGLDILNSTSNFTVADLVTGTLPSALSELRSLRSISFRHIPIRGDIPEDVGQLNIEEIYLTDTKLGGSLPPNLFIASSVAGLRQIHLGNNFFTGVIPEALFGIGRRPDVVDLSWNYLTGTLPSSIVNMKDAAILDLSRNFLRGPVPVDLGDTETIGTYCSLSMLVNGSRPTNCYDCRGGAYGHSFDLSRKCASSFSCSDTCPPVDPSETQLPPDLVKPPLVMDMPTGSPTPAPRGHPSEPSSDDEETDDRKVPSSEESAMHGDQDAVPIGEIISYAVTGALLFVGVVTLAVVLMYCYAKRRRERAIGSTVGAFRADSFRRQSSRGILRKSVSKTGNFGEDDDTANDGGGSMSRPLLSGTAGGGKGPHKGVMTQAVRPSPLRSAANYIDGNEEHPESFDTVSTTTSITRYSTLTSDGPRSRVSKLSLDRPNLRSAYTSRTLALVERFEIPAAEIAVDEERILGAGCSGVVYAGEWSGNAVAVKVLKSSGASSEELSLFKREASRMASLRPHPNVVPFFGIAILDDERLAMVSPLCAGGSLDRHLYAGRSANDPNSLDAMLMADGDATSHQFLRTERPPLPIATVYRLIYGVASGLSHLHRSGIIHRDIAARNVLLNASKTIPMISDFGMSRLLVAPETGGEIDVDSLATARASVSDTTHAKTQTDVGPVAWMSPEQLRSLEYSMRSDVFSFGMLCWEILTRIPPWTGVPGTMVAHRVLAGERVPLRSSVDLEKTPDWLLQLVEECWQEEPSARPHAAQLVSRIKEHIHGEGSESGRSQRNTSRPGSLVSSPARVIEALPTTEIDGDEKYDPMFSVTYTGFSHKPKSTASLLSLKSEDMLPSGSPGYESVIGLHKN